MARKSLAVFVVAGVVCITLVTPAIAHHSHAIYEPVALSSFEGVVSAVSWRNPHMTVTVDVPQGDGAMQKWVFEGAGPAAMVASGITVEILKVGKKVKIIGHPARNKTRHEALLMGVEYNGRFYSRGGGTNLRDAEGR